METNSMKETATISISWSVGRTRHMCTYINDFLTNYDSETYLKFANPSDLVYKNDRVRPEIVAE
jgi:hypothetical protein